MKIPLLTLISLLTLFSHSHAKDAATRTCRILFPNRPADSPKTLHLFDGNTSQEVALPSMNFSPLYKIQNGNIQVKLLANKVDDPKNISPDAPFAEIPANSNDIYLLISSDPENKIAPVKIIVISLDNENFKVGQTIWINHTDNNIEAKLGDQVLSLRPESSKIIDTPFSNSAKPTSGYFNADFTYQAKAEDPFAPITEQQWWYDTNSRHLGFIQYTEGKLPKIYFFRDFRDP